jgi:CHAT domain-containing protein
MAAAATVRRGTSRVVLAAGPDVPNAEAEVDDLRRIYPGADTLTGRAATAEKVAGALDGADVAHLVAHGTFRSDNPLFSALQLADGELTVYDLELLEQAPRMLVLSACESGVTDVRTGDELMGFAAALFALGSQTLVASVVPVPDATTRPLMIAFHWRLAAGETPAAALAHAQALVSDGLGVSPAATAGFVCLGA